PTSRFHYQTNASLIAKHNWWAFTLSLAEQSKSNSGLERRKKDYVVSIYEIPSQLPVNGASYTSLGAHDDGSAWSNISITGSVFAQRVKTEGSFASAGISSRRGVELSTDTVIDGSVTGTSAGSNPFAGNAREVAESAGEAFPISSSSDGGRVAFIPINRGLEFYDRYTSTKDSEFASNSISPTAWDYYSIGAKQCAMKLDIIDVVGLSNQTPTMLRFSYWWDDPNDVLAGSVKSEVFNRADGSWPVPGTPAGDAFPFQTDISADGRISIKLHMERLAPFLTARNGGDFSRNHSLCVNPDYVYNNAIQKPSFPSIASDIALLLVDSSDLTPFSSRGFSLVTNLRLIIADDTNVEPVLPADIPADYPLAAGEDYYPPLSMFAPEKRYGNKQYPIGIEIEGQLGSVAKGNTNPVHIGDLKSGVDGSIVPNNISATLKPITHPAALPPINMMNWMVVIRERHQAFEEETSP
ncbi:MAG: hypothetical protein ACPG6P_05000, partial [Akkermansiaceae bacterium]